MEDTFTIRETPHYFIDWTDAYGEARQAIFDNQNFQGQSSTNTYSLSHPVRRENASTLLGWVRFTIRDIGGGTIEVTAFPIGAEYHTVVKRVVTDDGYTGEEHTTIPRMSKEIAPELEQYYQAMIQAIRQKWPQRTKKKPGRHKLKCNAWAEEQARQGRTVDDILDEWCKRYSQENGAGELDRLDDPRKSCAEAMRRANKK